MWEREEPPRALADGRRVELRALQENDSAAIAGLWRRLPTGSRRRFLAFEERTEADLASGPARRPDEGGTVAVAATNGRDRVVGVARFRPVDDGVARFWVFVDPAWQGVGLGTALVRSMAAAAQRAGIVAVIGDVPAGDVRMLDLLGDLGLEYVRETAPGGVRATVELRETQAYLEAVLAEQRANAHATLTPLFRPRSIAVVGAGDDPGSIGGLVWANLAASGFDGPIYPVNPRHRQVQGVTAHPRVSDCPSTPDLVVVCTPAAAVLSVVEDAGEAGAGGVCVISAGFAEVGAEGRARQDDIVDAARSHGMRLIGPNCMGLLRGGEPRFNTTFSPAFPPPGRVSFVSQSGALGLAALALLDTPALGINAFASVGNSADVSAAEVILAWDDDPDTDVILVYLESVPDPRTFARAARHVARHTPIVAVKAGRSGPGQRAAASHTAALAAGDAAVDALMHQAGIVRADTLEELFDVATILATQPAPPGRRVAVLTNGGGPGILVADACTTAGLLVPELSPATQATLRALLPPGAAVSNPIDMVATATAQHYRRCLEVLADDDAVDAVIVIFIPPFLTRPAEVADEIAAATAASGGKKPIIASFLTAAAPPPALAAAGVPSFSYPERAARALGRVATWAEWRARPEGRIVIPAGIDRHGAREVIARAHVTDGGWVDARSAASLLDAFGIPTIESRRVRTPEEARSAAADLGGTVVLKLSSPIHKSDVGGVRIGLRSPDEVAEAARAMRAGLAARGMAAHGAELLVQPQVSGGVEMLVGITHDHAFGPLVAVGLGGTFVEALGDVALRMTPLTDLDVDEMLRSLRAYRLLSGFRGSPPADVASLADILHRVSAMAEEVLDLRELDLNPVFVGSSGAVVADARIRLRAAHDPR